MIEDRHGLRPIIRPVLLLVIGALAVHVLLPQVTALRHSLGVVKGLWWPAVFLSLLAQAGSYWGNAYVLRSVVRLFGRQISQSRAAAIVLAAYSLGLIWGGQVTYSTAVYRWLRSAEVTGEASLFAGLTPALVNVFTVCMVAIFGLGYLLLRGEITPVLVGLTLAGLALIVATGVTLALAVAYRHRAAVVLEAILRRWAQFRHHAYTAGVVEPLMERIARAWQIAVSGGWKGPIFGDAMNVGFDILTLYLLFLAAHHPIGVGVLLTGYGLPVLAGKLAVLPGGVGIVEASMTAIYTSLGVPAAVAVVVVIAYRLVSFWLPVVFGFPLILFLDRSRITPAVAQPATGP